jgi:hypothetical protein
MTTEIPWQPGVKLASSTDPPTRRRVYEPELTTPEREQRLERIDLIARLMDDAFTIPGINYRVGWDALIGLIPVAGDAVSAAITAWLIYEARQLGLPRRKVARMLANLGIDAAVGLIPLLGDVFDVAFKANRKNARIVRKHFGRSDGPTV